MSEELKTLSFKTADIEPGKAEPIKVELGGKTYTARCPNDFEFSLLGVEFDKLKRKPETGNIVAILEKFFDETEFEDIYRRSLGSNPPIELLADITPCLGALFEHYGPIVDRRMKEVQKKISVPKER